MERALPVFAASLFFALCVVSDRAHAQTYPNKSIRLIVPFPPGGPADILSRAIGQKLTDSWGQQVVVDNRAGAGGTIGSDLAAKGAPDGYTLLMGFVGTHAINPSLYSSLPYDNVKSFEPVSLVATATIILVLHPSLPAKSVKELIALAKSKPGELTFGSPGNGTPQHLAGELFNTMAGVKMTHVPFKGAVPAINDLLGGRISLIFSSAPPALPHVATGKLKALAVTSGKRSSVSPDLPTVAESGLPGFEVINWYGVLAPARTPKSIVEKLSTEVTKIMKMPDVKERLSSVGIEAFSSTPAQFAAFMKDETAKWAKVVKFSGARLD
ncbi:MAG: Bug family tripartite tricarboxylate transporter substrate binding protein [Betaproteobacteria bacterium]